MLDTRRAALCRCSQPRPPKVLSATQTHYAYVDDQSDMRIFHRHAATTSTFPDIEPPLLRRMLRLRLTISLAGGDPHAPGGLRYKAAHGAARSRRRQL